MTPEEIFQKHYKGIKNGMTPNLVEYGWIVEGHSAYELSCNNNGSLFGVTVLTDNQFDTEWSGAFDTSVDAYSHITQLKNKFGHIKVYWH